jgi:hypothetical protein
MRTGIIIRLKLLMRLPMLPDLTNGIIGQFHPKLIEMILLVLGDQQFPDAYAVAWLLAFELPNCANPLASRLA